MGGPARSRIALEMQRHTGFGLQGCLLYTMRRCHWASRTRSPSDRARHGPGPYTGGGGTRMAKSSRRRCRRHLRRGRDSTAADEGGGGGGGSTAPPPLRAAVAEAAAPTLASFLAFLAFRLLLLRRRLVGAGLAPRTRSRSRRSCGHGVRRRRRRHRRRRRRRRRRRPCRRAKIIAMNNGGLA
jgi:hypothetical protein